MKSRCLGGWKLEFSGIRSCMLGRKASWIRRNLKPSLGEFAFTDVVGRWVRGRDREYARVGEFRNGVVLERRDSAVGVWRKWIREDPLIPSLQVASP